MKHFEMKYLAIILSLVLFCSCNPKLSTGLRKNDLKRDVEMVTTKGTMVIRLSDSTPLHRDNFIRLVKEKFYDSILFHRVINNFMIQAGDPGSKSSSPVQRLGSGEIGYTIPAEFRETMFHKKGVIAAARMADDVNPQKASSGSQFYIVQGRIFDDKGLDSVETFRLRGRKLPISHREIYKRIGGTPHLDQNYSVFGEVVKGMNVIDTIASVPTSEQQGGDRPLTDVRILKTRLIKRK